MSTPIFLTNGSQLLVLSDGETDTTTTPLSLFGVGADPFLEKLNEDLVHITENFADATPPVAPLVGQLWYDSVNQVFGFWNGQTWSDPAGNAADAAFQAATDYANGISDALSDVATGQIILSAQQAYDDAFTAANLIFSVASDNANAAILQIAADFSATQDAQFIAQVAAAQAVVAADNSAVFANSASSSASIANGSAEIATENAAAAATYAADAASSQSAALGSANSAAISATEAGTFASNAATEAFAAESASLTANTAASSAQTYSNSAASSATSASGSASAASTSAGLAVAAENAAANSASSASSFSNSAVGASNTANSANAAAWTAAGLAVTAETGANTAQTAAAISATQAITASTTANTAATTATTEATIATTAATNANTAAAASSTSATIASSNATASAANAIAAHADMLLAQSNAGSAATSASASAISATTAQTASNNANSAANASVVSYTAIQANVATLSATVASVQTAQASNAATLASETTSLQAQIASPTNYLNKSATFTDYVASGGTPNNWLNWGNATADTRGVGLDSPYSLVEVVSSSDALHGVLNRVSNVALGWYVIEAHVTLNSGSFINSGVLWQGTNAIFSIQTDGALLSFTTEPTATGGAVGNGVVGQTYSWTKLVQFTNSATVAGQLYAMTSGSGEFVGGTVAKTISWHKLGVRYASADEIQLGQALANTGQATLSASFTAAALTASNATNAVAATVSTLSSQVTSDVAALNASITANATTLATATSAVATTATGLQSSLNTLAAQSGTSYLNAGATFANWPNSGSMPPNWVIATGSGSNFTQATGTVSQYALQIAGSAGVDDYAQQYIASPISAGWYVLEADIKLVSGSLNGAALWINYYESVANGSTFRNSDHVIFTADPDVNNVVQGAGQAGQYYLFRKTVQINDALVGQALLYPMAHYMGAGSNAAANVIQFNRAGFRPATAGELAGVNANASVNTLTTTVTGLTGALSAVNSTVAANFATSQATVAASALNIDPTFSQWTGSSTVPPYYADWQSNFSTYGSKQTGTISPYAARFSSVNNGTPFGVYSPEASVRGHGGTGNYVIEATIKLISGTFSCDGFYLQSLNSSSAQDSANSFTIAAVIGGSGTAGQTYEISQLVTLSTTTSVGLQLYAMHWPSNFGADSSVVWDLERMLVRPASSGEVAGISAAASVITIESAAATTSSALASLTTTVSSNYSALKNLAQPNPNLIVDGNFENSEAGWAGWQSGAVVYADPNYGWLAYSGLYSSSTWFLGSALIPVQAGQTYTISGNMESAGSGSTGWSMGVNWYNSGGSYLSGTGYPAQTGVLSGNGPNYTQTFVAVTGATHAQVYLAFYGTGANVGGYAQRIKLEVGSVATAYDATASVVTTQSALTTLSNQAYASYGLTVNANGAFAGFYEYAASGGTSSSGIVLDAESVSIKNGSNSAVALMVTGSSTYINSLYVQALNTGAIMTVGSGDWPVALQAEQFSVADGTTVSFGVDLGTPPNVNFTTTGLAPLSSSQVYLLTANSLTSTGFTASLKILTPGTTTNNTYGANTTVEGSGPHIWLAVAAGNPYNGVYNFSGLATVYQSYFGPGDYGGGDTLTMYTYDSTNGWVARGTTSAYPSRTGTSSGLQTGRSWTGSVTVSDASTITYVGVSTTAVDPGGGGSTSTCPPTSLSVSYATQSGSTTASATPTTGQVSVATVYPQNIA